MLCCAQTVAPALTLDRAARFILQACRPRASFVIDPSQTRRHNTFMKRMFIMVALACAALLIASPVHAQDSAAKRIATRDRLRKLLEVAGQEKDINIPFRQSDKNEFNFIGIKRDKLTNADFLEIVIGVSA